MGVARKLMAGLSLIAVAATAAAGCGGGGGEDTESRIFPWLEGPSREFLIPGGDNAVQTFGREASSAERAQASRVVAPWMAARAAKDHRGECMYLARAFTKNFVEDAENVSKGKVTTCAGALGFFGIQAAGVNYVDNTFGGSIDSLRVGEGHGYAQFHGKNGRDYIVPVNREDGEWKVGSAAPFDRRDAE